ASLPLAAPGVLGSCLMATADRVKRVISQAHRLAGGTVERAPNGRSLPLPSMVSILVVLLIALARTRQPRCLATVLGGHERPIEERHGPIERAVVIACA